MASSKVLKAALFPSWPTNVTTPKKYLGSRLSVVISFVRWVPFHISGVVRLCVRAMWVAYIRLPSSIILESSFPFSFCVVDSMPTRSTQMEFLLQLDQIVHVCFRHLAVHARSSLSFLPIRSTFLSLRLMSSFPCITDPSLNNGDRAHHNGFRVHAVILGSAFLLSLTLSTCAPSFKPILRRGP